MNQRLERVLRGVSRVSRYVTPETVVAGVVVTGVLGVSALAGGALGLVAGGAVSLAGAEVIRGIREMGMGRTRNSPGQRTPPRKR